MHNWVAGEEITAVKLNDLNPAADDRISKAEHNILELYLENYFASKNTPFQGLFFDGFSDTNKAQTSVGNIASAAVSGQANVALANQSEVDLFPSGSQVEIYDGSNRESNIASGSTTGPVTDFTSSDLKSADGFAYSETDSPGFWFDDGVVSGKRRVRRTGNGSGYGSAGDGGFLTKTLTVVNGANYRVQVICNWNFPDSQAGKIQLLVDGVVKQQKDPLGDAANGYATTGTISFDVNATASGTSMSIVLKCVQNSNFSSGSQDTADWSNFSVTHTGYLLIMQNNLANSYAQGGFVKFTTATLDTGNKKLTVTSGVGNGKYFTYLSKRQSFIQKMASVKLWIMRNNLAKYSPNGAVSNGATTVAQQMQSGTFAINDILDIFTANGLVRERKTVTNVVESGGGTLTIDQVTTNLANNQTTHTMAHVTNSNSSRLLLVAIESWGDSNGNGQIPTGVTYNGVAMTQLVSGNNGNGRNGISFWKLLNPATGTNNVVATYSSGPPNQRITAIGFYNARDTATATNFGFVTNTFNKNITGETGGICVDLLGCDLGNPSLSVNGGQTVRSTDNYRTGVSTKPAAGGATSMGWTMSNYEGNYMGVCVLPVIPTLTMTFSPAIQNAGGFATSDFFERVDVKPKISIVASGANPSYVDLTYESTMPQVIQEDGLTYYEDEYTYVAGTPNNDVMVKLEITRGDVGLSPCAKRLGVSLNT